MQIKFRVAFTYVIKSVLICTDVVTAQSYERVLLREVEQGKVRVALWDGRPGEVGRVRIWSLGWIQLASIQATQT